MAIESDAGMGMEEAVEESSETVDIPTTMLAGQTVTPGDVVRLEVVSLNDDMGTITVKYSTDEAMPGGIAEAAAAFEE